MFMFEVAEAYERQKRRSSKILAPLFVDFVGVQGEVLDVGLPRSGIALQAAFADINIRKSWSV